MSCKTTFNNKAVFLNILHLNLNFSVVMFTSDKTGTNVFTAVIGCSPPPPPHYPENKCIKVGQWNRTQSLLVTGRGLCHCVHLLWIKLIISFKEIEENVLQHTTVSIIRLNGFVNYDVD